MSKEFSVERFSFVSASDGLVLQAIAFLPEKPKGIVQFVHGMCEHIGRYEETMAYFAKNGYIACGYDQRGHGESVACEEEFGFFGEDGSATAIVDDAIQFTKLVKEKYPNLPVCLYGHSMGSMVVRVYLQKADEEIDKLVVSGSPCKNGAVGIAIGLVTLVKRMKGAKHRSELLKTLTTGGADKAFPESAKAWLSRDKAVQEQFVADPKCGFTFTANGFDNLLHVLKKTYVKKLYQPKNPTLPIFFVAGSEDPIIGNQKKWLFGQNFLRKVGYQAVEGKLYEGMRHEPHNELGKEEVWADVLAFLQK